MRGGVEGSKSKCCDVIKMMAGRHKLFGREIQNSNKIQERETENQKSDDDVRRGRIVL